MALHDISEVTRSLVQLLQQAFQVSPAWTAGGPPSILPEPPVRTASDGLGFYLYHVTEHLQYKNLPAPGRDQPPVRFTPMALNLYYHLSANSTADDGSGAYLEQQMMGIAMKAFHDYPDIDDGTQINSVTIFQPSLVGRDNRFRITLQPQPPNEAVNFWTAGESPLKLSAYYEVSVVLLEPETIQSRAGRVLAYGVYTFTEGAPRLFSSQNVLSFTIPGETNAREVKLQPAQVPVAAGPDSRVTFFGAGFGGDEVDLLLIQPRWPEPALATPGWTVAAGTNEVSAVVQETATLVEAGTPVDILPGVYAAQVRVTRRRPAPGGGMRTFVHLSNQCPFTITPRIDAITGPDAGNIVIVEGYLFQHPDLPAGALQVYLGGDRLAPAGASLDPGEFEVIPGLNPGDPPRIRLRLPGGLTPGQVIPLRLFIQGAESPPEWIVIP